MVRNIEQTDFETEVLASTTPVLVDFWAPWCGPCRAVAPILDELSADYGDRLNIVKINVDSAQELAVQYGVRSIPTLLLFRAGKLAETVIGAQPKPQLAAAIDRVLAPRAA